MVIGDGYRAPAVLLSDKRALCNITSPVAGSKKLGLIFANVLQAQWLGTSCWRLAGLREEEADLRKSTLA